MAINKKSEFSLVEQEIATFAKVLGHPARVSILNFLAQQSSCVCGDIVDKLPLAQSTVSQHLKELKDVGLIKGNVEGPKICYCIDVDNFARMSDSFAKYVESLKLLQKSNCC